MTQANQPAKRVRFGVFEADFRTGELIKRGRRVRLQEQPFQLLAMLLDRPGELVTREELHGRLWPQTTIDFDHGLNKAVSKLREALGDSADSPRFIETVARRGYRFLADVATVDDTQAEIAQNDSGVSALLLRSGTRKPAPARHRAGRPARLRGSFSALAWCWYSRAMRPGILSRGNAPCPRFIPWPCCH